MIPFFRKHRKYGKNDDLTVCYVASSVRTITTISLLYFEAEMTLSINNKCHANIESSSFFQLYLMVKACYIRTFTPFFE